MSDVTVYVNEAGDWFRCIDGCCWNAGWDAETTAGRNVETIVDDVKFSDGAEKGAVGNLKISENAVRDATESAVENVVTNANGNASYWDCDDLRIFANVETSADVLKFSERVDENAGANANAVDIDETFRYVKELGRDDDLNDDLNEGFDAATRAFSASRNDLILNEVNFFSSSHFSISFLDHAVRFLLFSVFVNVFAIEILSSWNIHTLRILKKCRNSRNCILLIRLKSFSV